MLRGSGYQSLPAPGWPARSWPRFPLWEASPGWWAWPLSSGGSWLYCGSQWLPSRKLFSVFFKIFSLIYFFYIKIFVSLQSRSCRWGCRYGERRRDCGGGRGRSFRWRGRGYKRRVSPLQQRLRHWRWGRFWRAFWWSAPAPQHGNAS